MFLSVLIVNSEEHPNPGVGKRKWSKYSSTGSIIQHLGGLQILGEVEKELGYFPQ